MTENKTIFLPESISVRALADKIGIEPNKLITELVNGGVMAHINQIIDFDTASLVSEKFDVVVEPEEKTSQIISKTSDSKSAVSRSPIITIMGHVDHGKTTLLDYIRQSSVAKGESGGITQHISAYQIDFEMKEGQKRKITFIDTPGHEAFTALRAHGAALTDLVILVVAADDGIKPQTVEAIEQARASNAPIVVAINKIDVGKTNIDRVKQQLADHDLLSEDWGGKTVVVPISAKTGEGVHDLLELVVLTTDLMDLKADPDASPEAVVIDAHLDKKVGPSTIVLVYNGTLRTGQVVVVGNSYGRIKSMENDISQSIISALPAQPAVILGLKDVPQFGDRLVVVPSEKVARTMTQKDTAKVSSSQDEKDNTVNVIIKADVGGSLAALQGSLDKLEHKDARVKVVSSGIGSVNENDLNLAKASHALLIAFRAPTPKRIIELIQKESVELLESWVIYEVIENLTERLKVIATPVFETIELGRLKILEVFSQKIDHAIVGGDVTEGKAIKNSEIKVFRNKEEIGTATSTSLKIGKVETDQVEKGSQCGVALEKLSIPIEKGDLISFNEIKEV